MLLACLCVGCSSDHDWSNLTGGLGNAFAKSKIATIDIADFSNGRLHISGRCGEDGEVLLVLPATKGDRRVIGSPRCSRGRYDVVTSKFGRPPCDVMVEYNGGYVEAEVEGVAVYCN